MFLKSVNLHIIIGGIYKLILRTTAIVSCVTVGHFKSFGTRVLSVMWVKMIPARVTKKYNNNNNKSGLIGTIR